MPSRALFFVVALIVASNASAQEDESMMRARIITALLTHSREPLKGHTFCESFTGLEGTKATRAGRRKEEHRRQVAEVHRQLLT